MITITLNKKELSEAKQHTNFRQQLSRASNIVHKERSKKWTHKEIEYLGVRSEIAVSKLFELGRLGVGIDDGSDFYFDDVSIDVKSTFYPSGRLIFPSKDSVKADVLVLVTESDEASLCIKGWCPREYYLKNALITDLGNGDTLVLDDDKLFPVEDLWLYLQQQRHSA